ncbi:amino acid adenylation domain-containing protein [Pseudoalteromonas piscicida]|uniref:amino acid adenylation domain-containing protein n=1 Tax=Pseudoalteromonas piscicida TaxID=43662 RepID=UPI0030B6EEF1
MNIGTLLFQLQQKKISISASGEALEVTAPKGVLTKEIQEQIKQYKEPLLSFLNEYTQAPENVLIAFHRCVERFGERIAVEDNARSVTYRELNEMANKLANLLLARGAGPETKVGVHFARGIESITAMLAALKVGAVYVPMNIDLGVERSTAYIQSGAVEILVTKGDFLDLLPTFELSFITCICIDEEQASLDRSSPENPDVSVDLNQGAYVIHTSGSTGEPKGVVATHLGLANLNRWHKLSYQTCEHDTATQIASDTFDAHIWEIFPYLTSGAKLVVVSDDVRLDMGRLCNLLRSKQVTQCFLPTSLADVFLKHPEANTLALHNLFVGGELLTQSDSSDYPFDIINHYGPTEYSVVATRSILSKSKTANSQVVPPIGYAIAGTEAYILNDQLEVVSQGDVGELYLSGKGLARGYLNNPVSTAEAFIPDPYAKQPGAYMYKTGDLVKQDDDGQIRFVGRADQQIKVRGIRLEPAEIEIAAKELPQLREVAVVQSEEDKGSLIAFCVPESGAKQAFENWNEHVDDWTQLYDENYSLDVDAQPGSRFVGWNNSFDGSEIPLPEMEGWANETVKRISELNPKRVLEIGCGTGILLFRLIESTEHYLGVDISDEALKLIKSDMKRINLCEEKLSVHRASAHQISEVPDNGADIIVLNSVIQYFPDREYLSTVINDCVERLPDGGHIFLGDVRDLRLLPAFHCAIDTHQLGGSRAASEIALDVEHREQEDEELCLSPEFFYSLEDRAPRISSVRVMPKLSTDSNEMVKYRFDVVISVAAKESALANKPTSCTVMEWPEYAPKVDSVLALVKQHDCSQLYLKSIPNGLIYDDVKRVNVLKSASDSNISLINLLSDADDSVHCLLISDVLAELEAAGYNAAPLINNDNPACFDLHIWHSSVLQPQKPTPEKVNLPRLPVHTKLANEPLKAKRRKLLKQQVRKHLQTQLPDYMQPQHIVALDSLPTTANSKIDRKELSSYRFPSFLNSHSARMPVTAAEKLIAQWWSEALGVERIGMTDSFYELGGHSLMATRLISTINEITDMGLSVALILENPTIEQVYEKLAVAFDGKEALEEFARLYREVEEG